MTKKSSGIPCYTGLCCAALLVCEATNAAPAPLMGKMEPVQLDSGPRANPKDSPEVVFAQELDLGPDVPWVRVLIEKETTLAPGSFIRVTSLLDGETQLLDAEELENWNYGTAFFNGSLVQVELIAGARTAGNAVHIQEIIAADLATQDTAQPIDEDDDGSGGIASICGAVDTRTLSNDKRVGRLLPGMGRMPGDPPPNDPAPLGWCTSFIVDAQDGRDKLHLTAGHCFDPYNPVNQNLPVDYVLQFNVPASNANCTIKHPAVADQFPVRRDTVISRNTSNGNDWAMFKCSPNGLGETTYERAGNIAFSLKANPPGVGMAVPVEIIGYGADGNAGGAKAGDPRSCRCKGVNGTQNSVQQKSVGTTMRSADKEVGGVNVVYRTNAPTCGGNSGSPVINQSGQVIAIHTGRSMVLCGLCVGGANGGNLCKSNADCPGGACAATPYLCVGGANNGNVCNSNADCPDGVCNNAAPGKNDGDTATDHPEIQDAIELEEEKKPVPAISAWGVVVMSLLLLTAGKVAFRKSRALAS